MRTCFYNSILAFAKKSIWAPISKLWNAHVLRRTRSYLVIHNIYIINSYIIISHVHSTNMSSDKNLAVFDFDLTIASENTDTEVIKLVQNDIPQKVKDINRTQGWTAFMAEIFNILHEQNCDKHKIYEVISNIPETNGMTDLLNALHNELNFDIIIISDSNLLFITDWLEVHKLDSIIEEVFTNPAEYNDSGKLIIQPYQDQTECKRCPRNLCKSSVMKKFIELKKKLGVRYSKVIYAGDGSNDFCPMLNLSNNDIAFPRIGYKCVQKIEKCKDNPEFAMKAFVHPWNNAYDILNVLIN